VWNWVPGISGVSAKAVIVVLQGLMSSKGGVKNGFSDPTKSQIGQDQ